MRNPFRSEAEAFSFVLVCVALFAAVARGRDPLRRAGWRSRVFVVLAVAVAFYVKGEPKAPAEPVQSRAGEGTPPHPRRRERDRAPAARSAARSSGGPERTPTSSSSARL